MYNFFKVPNSNGFFEFKHPNFKKGNFLEIGHIKRRYVGDPLKKRKINNSIRSTSDNQSRKHLRVNEAASDQLKTLCEENGHLNARIDELEKERTEQFDAMSSIVSKLYQHLGATKMQQIKVNILNENELTVLNKWSPSNAVPAFPAKRESEVCVDNEPNELASFKDNLSDLIGAHLRKIQQSSNVNGLATPIVNMKTNQSESCFESIIDDTGDMRYIHNYSNNQNVLEALSVINAYDNDPFQIQSTNSKVEEQTENNEDTEDAEFDQSRKYSINLFDSEEQNCSLN
jgi:hypothetical protein